MNNLIEGQQGTTVLLSAKLTRHYKTSSLELGITLNVEVKGETDLTRAYEQLIEHLQREHKTQVERLVAQGGGGQTIPTPAEEKLPEGVDIDEINVEHIEVETKGGKRYYKIFGGRWTKHGVRMWLDPATIGAVEHLIRFEDLPNDKTEVKSKNIGAKISMNGDKPVKVLTMFAKSSPDARVNT